MLLGCTLTQISVVPNRNWAWAFKDSGWNYFLKLSLFTSSSWPDGSTLEAGFDF